MVISDCYFLGVYHSRQSTNKPDCCSQHQFSPDVIIPALYRCSCLFLIPAPPLPLFWFHFLSSLPHPSDTSLCLFFLYPDLSKFLCMPACCHCAMGIWRDDQVKMMCFAASFFFLARCGCIILYPQQFRRCSGAHWRQLHSIQGLLRC